MVMVCYYTLINLKLIKMKKKVLLLSLFLNLFTLTTVWSQFQTNINGHYYTYDRIGIGTGAPGFLFDIYEKKGIGTALRVNSQAGAKPNLVFGVENVSVVNLRYDDQGTNNFQLMMRKNDELYSAMDITSAGNIGIGTTKFDYVSSTGPIQAKLALDGYLVCEGITVVGEDNVPSSDYVFEADYNLLSLTEVETFIKENKHLPEVPSAEEFKNKGYSLGQMDDLLLRKIEELTLYMIEQQKLLKQQSEEIRIIKNENMELMKTLK